MTRRPRPRSARSWRWSPRCAGSGPTRACGPGSGSPPCSAGSAARRWPPTRTRIRSLLRLTAPGDGFTPDRVRWTPRASRSSWTPAARSTSPPSARRLEKDLAAARKEADAGRAQARQRRVPGQGARPRWWTKTRRRLDAARADIARISGRVAALAGEPDRRGRHGHRPRAGPAPARGRGARSSPAVPSTRSSRPWTGSAALATLLGDPQRAYPVIHVTGTNGKTSTARMIETLLRARGLRTGRFTSPHLSRHPGADRASTASRCREAFARRLRRGRAVRGAGRRAQQPVRLSFFEVLTAMAFAAFADAPVDVAVIEVGLGGTWDATNVADGAVAVVTPVALDHTALPGRHDRGDRRREGGHHQARRGRGPGPAAARGGRGAAAPRRRGGRDRRPGGPRVRRPRP